MNSKFVGAVLLTSASLILSSSGLRAASSSNTDTKIAYYTAKLQKLKAGTATYSTVRALTTRLARLDPIKANYYYKIAIKKMQVDLRVPRATRLRNALARIVTLSDLTPAQTNHVLQSLRRTEMRVAPAEPTPTPYQAGRDWQPAGEAALA
jgi:hypothetical protein